MKRFRMLPLLFLGLGSALNVAAQSAAPVPAGPQPTDVLSWITWGAAAIVLLMALITAASVASANEYRRASQPDSTPALPADHRLPTPTDHRLAA